MPDNLQSRKRALIADLESATLDATALDVITALIQAVLADQVRGDEPWTIRDEANALTAMAFRNGFLEELHAGKHSELLADPTLSRITDKEMRKLMIESSVQLARMLHLKEADAETYSRTIRWFRDAYCARWERTATRVDITK